jgi:coenzyme PQQ precursor peptide PqqA
LLNAAQAVAYLGRVEPLVLRRLVSGRPRRCGRIVVPELARQEVRNGAQGATTGAHRRTTKDDAQIVPGQILQIGRNLHIWILSNSRPLWAVIGGNTMAWTTPTLIEICIGLEINGYLPAEF